MWAEAGRDTLRMIQAKTGCVSAAAILCVIAPTWLIAQTTPPGRKHARRAPTGAADAADAAKDQSTADCIGGEHPPAGAPRATGGRRAACTGAGTAGRRAVNDATCVSSRIERARRPQSLCGPGGALQSRSLASGKFPEPILNTPKTVTVLTKELLADKNATTLKQAILSTSGVTLGTRRRRQRLR